MKETIGSVSVIIFMILISIGYINNLIWIFDNWSILGYGTKFFNIIGIFVPPLGGFIGIYHFF